MIQVHHMCCALYFYYYYISSTSDHQAVGPRGWASLEYSIVQTLLLYALGNKESHMTCVIALKLPAVCWNQTHDISKLCL